MGTRELYYFGKGKNIIDKEENPCQEKGKTPYG
jgi:hypothetical protein